MNDTTKDTRLAKTPGQSLAEAMRTVIHSDVNGENRLFGGRLMEWIDDIAGIAARRHCGGSVTTACVDMLQFKNPAYLNDIVILRARVTYVGNTSLEVRVDSYVEDVESEDRKLINTAYLTEVYMGTQDKPTRVPYALRLCTKEERDENESALFRREIRKTRKQAGI